MQDIISKYNKHKIISNLWILVTSIIVALWINFLLIDWTEIWQNFKASVLGVNDNGNETKSDIFFEQNGEKTILKTSKNMKNVKSISLSMVYNPENIEINNLVNNNNQITNIGNEDWIKSIIINFDNAVNINENDNILEFSVQKKGNKTENINIVNANFTDDTWEIYMFSTSGISL